MIDPIVVYGKQYVSSRNSLVTAQEENSITSFKTLNVRVLYF